MNARGAVLGDEVYSILGRAILDGTLQPGERLRDVDLAERLQVSRTPVREALQRLERFGLVEVSANRWTRVATPSENALRDTTEFMAFVVGGAFRTALSRCSEEQLSLILEAADAVIAASDAQDAPGIMAGTVMFFQQVIRATGNTVFISIMRESGLALQRNLRGWTPDIEDAASRSNSYRRLREAVAARDGAAAQHELLAINLLG
ncbi:GntR family transcriptional regulator [Microbacterium pygmaeum]|uniref:GntR family transcriptional regulator n=1 Tax=Microbacterium pygmaeum TaxID=370764 RepID=UPI001E529710|nr:GntR family transcriptional regulator [Microbacterium pygmaeum]